MKRQSRYRWVDLRPNLLPTRLWGQRLPVDEWQVPEDWAPREEPLRAKLFAKQAVGVSELYSHQLSRATPVPAEHGWISLNAIDPEDPDYADVTLSYGEAFPRSAEHLGAWLDPAVLDLPVDERPRAYLAWLQPILLGLAVARGVPATGFEEAFDATLAAGCLMRWEAPGRSSPDRRFRAIPHYAIDPYGDAWVRLTVHDRTGALVTEGGPWETWPHLRDWRRDAKTLTWLSPTDVRIETYPSTTAEAWGVQASHTLALA